jgi:hypothetical protein
LETAIMALTVTFNAASPIPNRQLVATDAPLIGSIAARSAGSLRPFRQG